MNIDKTNSSSFIQSYQKQMQVTPAQKARPLQQEEHLQISSSRRQAWWSRTSLNDGRKLSAKDQHGSDGIRSSEWQCF